MLRLRAQMQGTRKVGHNRLREGDETRTGVDVAEDGEEWSSADTRMGPHRG